MTGEETAPPARPLWCRRCEGQLTRAAGGPEHAATGDPVCADGVTMAVPDRTDPAKRRAAREIEADFPEWRVSLPFNGLYFRADVRNPPPGTTAAHYLGDDAEALRARLAGVTERANR